LKTFKPTIIATTALSLLMTGGAYVSAAPSNINDATLDRIITGPAPQREILLAQGGQSGDVNLEELVKPRKPKKEGAAQPAGEAPAAQGEEPAPKPERRQAQPKPAPEESPAPRQAQPEQPAAEKPAPRQAQPAEPKQPPAEKPVRKAQPAAEPEAPAVKEAQPKPRPEQPAAEKPVRRAQPAAPAAKPEAPAVEQAEPGETPREKRLRERREALRKLQESGGSVTGAGDNAQPAEPATPRQAQPETPAQPATPEAPRQAQPAQPAEPAQPADPNAPRQAQPAKPAQPVVPGAAEQAQPNETPREKRLRERREALRKLQESGGSVTGAGDNAQPAQPPVQQAQPGVIEGAPENAAPVLDSQKRNGRKPRDGEATVGGEPVAPPIARAPTPPPTSDEDAQANAPRAEDLKPVTEEKGERRQGPRRFDRPEASDVLAEIGKRVILELGNQVIVESDDRERFRRGAQDVYYEDLPRGRTRETITRANGVTIVTVRDRYGDVIRRSRITPDGREYVLTYVDEQRPGWRDGEWRDPGDELPPLVIEMPYEDYIFDAERVDYNDDEAYYEFLEQPPVEKVERLYSVDEVKRSARVRDSVRRIDLDTITFETGSAVIADSEVERLDGVANAMLRILEKNPAETFLIEGHTDAVGSDNSNLALSDERAEAVASALSTVFEIPPENLTTQGYGEQYLKIDTAGAERQNRRVAIRRITALVAPVASAQ
jgi:outer membrane protein OmpA-like peptidoglycan-associated protein